MSDTEKTALGKEDVSSATNSENDSLNQYRIEKKAAELKIPPEEYRRMVSKN